MGHGVDPALALVRLTGARPRVVVAFSGGVDSTVLAHALVRARRKLGGLRLVHVDHRLQAASAQWSRRCARQARAWGVAFVGLRAHIHLDRGHSPEAAARDARYALLAATMQPGEVLVTAHHQDDQVETLLLQLFRGAGVAGLAAMPAITKFGPGRLARPLLDVPRAALEAYARTHGLRWSEDPTNAETIYARNYLRHRVLPAIRQRWVGVDASIARTARHMAEAQNLLHATALRDLNRVADGDGLSVAGLKALPRARRINALRVFIARTGIEVPHTAQFLEIAGSLLAARSDANPEQKIPGAVVRRRGGRLEIEVVSQDAVACETENFAKSWHWGTDREFVLNGAGDVLALVDDADGPVDLDRLPPVILVRARRGGETIRPGMHARTQALKKLLQAAKLPLDARARIPLLFDGRKLPEDTGPVLAAGDRWVDASIMANVKSRRRARLVWRRREK
jgi:tRNA(Ile)-lysidine synthase